MSVLTRAESQQRTRQSLLASATKLFLEDGFVATSQAQIAAHAGYTRGAVYANFPNKAAIGVAVIDGLYADAFDDLEEALAAVPVEQWLSTLAEWATRTMGDPAWARLEIEVAAHGDESVRAATANRYAELRTRVARLAQEYVDRLGLSVTVPADIAGQLLVGLGMGLGLQRAIDPESIGPGPLNELLEAADFMTMRLVESR